jgi:diguanylate cyclase (GGDEF)-like protein
VILKNFNKRSLFTLVLLFSTFVVYGLNQTYQREIDLLDYPFRVTTDNAFNGGTSVGYAEAASGEGLVLECVLTDVYEWRFCELQFELHDQQGKGINLEQYNHLLVDASLVVDGVDQGHRPIRLYFKQRAFQYSDGVKPSSIEFPPAKYQQGVPIPLSFLKVPDWWRLEHAAGLFESQAEVSEIVEVSLSTPAQTEPGTYRILLKGMSVSGPWIPHETLVNILLIVWLTHSISNLIYSFRETRRENLLLSWEYKQLQNENSHLVNLAHKDKLTGALNRHGAHKVIFEQTPVKSVISIIYLDIDHFKSINDTHSHQAGDAILIMLANLIESSIGEDHFLVRWGGEEFVILCHDISAHAAAKIAVRLQERFAQVEWPYVKDLTCSFGVATCKNIDMFNQAIDRADKALYLAKARGRDKIEIAPEDA